MLASSRKPQSQKHNAKSARRVQSERGVAAIEFALIMPILILLVFGIIEFGRVYSAKITLTHAAREAVRTFVITEVVADTQAVGQAAAAQLSGVSITIVDACDDSADNPDTATIAAEWDMSYDIPLVSSGTISLSEEAVMRCGA